MSPAARIAALLSAVAVALLPACETAPDPVDVAIDAACEWSNPRECLLPWPSDRWLTEDASTETGFRLDYDGDLFPTNSDDDPFMAEEYDRFDGFPPSAHMLTMFEQPVDVSNLAWVDEYDESLLPDSPTVIVDLATGERIAHFAEIDTRAGEDFADFVTDVPTLFYLHPAKRLREGRTYGVALRNIVLADGTAAQATRPFEVLRDNIPTTSDAIEADRPRYEALFEGLAAAGVEREDLVQAWSFTTATGSTIRRDMLAVKADWAERVPEGFGDCTVEEVKTTGISGHLDRVVKGTFQAPLYMDADAPGSRFVRDADGLPSFQGWATLPFVVNVPKSLAEHGDGRLIQFGHGLMGSAEHEMSGSFGSQFPDDYGFIMVGTDWQGMSRDDLTNVAQSLADVSQFPTVAERLIQGMAGEWTLTRSFRGGCRELPELIAEDGTPLIGDEVYFVGISQGGILGGTFMATSPDIERGTLIVGSMDFPFTMTRSLNWVEYELILAAWYDRRIDREILVYVMGSLWDIADPNAYLPHVIADPLPDTPPKRILYQVAEGDLQVQTIAADRAVRTMGIPLLQPALRSVWGVEEATGPLDSAYVYYDLGGELPPTDNQLPEAVNDVHNDQRREPTAQAQIDAFFHPDGRIESFCEGACDPD